jgi:hypothetical protein
MTSLFLEPTGLTDRNLLIASTGFAPEMLFILSDVFCSSYIIDMTINYNKKIKLIIQSLKIEYHWIARLSIRGIFALNYILMGNIFEKISNNKYEAAIGSITLIIAAFTIYDRQET